MTQDLTPQPHRAPANLVPVTARDGHGHPEILRPDVPHGNVPVVAGIRAHHLERLIFLLRDRLPLVLESHWYFEDQTGLYNETGAHNLADALSHIGTLAERAPTLSDQEQGDQIVQIEDHLRRSMMEGFESVVDSFTEAIRKELWATYILEVAPLVAKKKLAESHPNATWRQNSDTLNACSAKVVRRNGEPRGRSLRKGPRRFGRRQKSRTIFMAPFA